MSPVQASLLLFTTLSGQLAEPGAVVLSLLEGDQVEDYYGWVAANLPDVDGDGVDDVIIPAIGYDNGAGRVTVYSGATRAVLADIVGVPGTLYGYSVGEAGDVDADGVPDYIVGGGRVEVFSGATHHLLWSLGGITGFLVFGEQYSLLAFAGSLLIVFGVTTYCRERTAASKS